MTVSCAGCGRTQTMRKSRLIICDGYTCSLGSCKLNPDFKLPKPAAAYICHIICNVAGSFSGWKICKATVGELRSMERARAIRDEGMKQLADESLKKLLNF